MIINPFLLSIYFITGESAIWLFMMTPLALSAINSNSNDAILVHVLIHLTGYLKSPTDNSPRKFLVYTYISSVWKHKHFLSARHSQSDLRKLGLIFKHRINPTY